MQKMMGLVRRCVEDYNMITLGETVAVGVSGGKDSLVLLQLLQVCGNTATFSWRPLPLIWGWGWIISLCGNSAKS